MNFYDMLSMSLDFSDRTVSPYDSNREVGAIGTKFYLLDFNTGRVERLTWGAFRHCRDIWRRDRKYLRVLGVNLRSAYNAI